MDTVGWKGRREPVRYRDAGKGDLMKRVFFTALAVRLAVLLIVMLTPWRQSFMGVNSQLADDWRYEAGALNYAYLARSPVDPEAFTRAFAVLGDSTGYVAGNVFSTAPLWYFVVCGLVYVFRSVWAVRLLNTVLSSLAAVASALFAREAYGGRAGRLTGGLMALLPYPVIFSCFAYKDSAVMALTMTLLYHAVLVRHGRRLSVARWLLLALAALALLTLRSGLSAVLLGACAVLALPKPGRAAVIVALTGVLLALVLGGRTLVYKLEYYLRQNASDGESALSMIKITGLKDLYKLPFAWMFAMITPFGLFGSVRSFYDLTLYLNVTLIPLAVGAALFAVKKKRDVFLYLVCLGYYLISVVPSLGIFRHLFSVMPLTVAFFSAWAGDAERTERRVWLLLSALAVLVLAAYYFRRNVWGA